MESSHFTRGALHVWRRAPLLALAAGIGVSVTVDALLFHSVARASDPDRVVAVFSVQGSPNPTVSSWMDFLVRSVGRYE